MVHDSRFTKGVQLGRSGERELGGTYRNISKFFKKIVSFLKYRFIKSCPLVVVGLLLLSLRPIIVFPALLPPSPSSISSPAAVSFMQVVVVVVVVLVPPNSISVSVSVSTSSSSVAVSPSVALGVDIALVLVASETERALFVGLPTPLSTSFNFSTSFSFFIPVAVGKLTTEAEAETETGVEVDTEVDSEGFDDWDLCVRERRGTRTRSARGLRWPYMRSMSVYVCACVSSVSSVSSLKRWWSRIWMIYDGIRIRIQKSASRRKIVSIPKVGVETIEDKKERERIRTRILEPDQKRELGRVRRDGDEQDGIRPDDEGKAVEPCVACSFAFRSSIPSAQFQPTYKNKTKSSVPNPHITNLVLNSPAGGREGRTNRIHRMRRQLENPVEHQIAPLEETVAPVPPVIFDDVVRFGFYPEVEGDKGCAYYPSAGFFVWGW